MEGTMLEKESKSTIELTADQLKFYDEQGYLIIDSPLVAELQEKIRSDIKETSLKIAERYEEGKSNLSELEAGSINDIVDWCVSNEKDRRISRAFYEVFPATTGIISLVSDPLLLSIAEGLGIGTPVPSTLPAIRVDRPGDEQYRTPPHCDYWVSMLSENSVVMWMPLTPLSSDMGLLQAIPGSHKGGMAPFEESSVGGWFTTISSYPDSDYVELPIADGQILVFSQNLLHRSGHNSSQKTRVSLQIRYNDLDTMKVMTSSFTPVWSTYVNSELKEHQERFSNAKG
jgi:ectoine hydroxylase-related dioxygenase (phytanoyl-CoA dioxygenase family)